MIIFLLNIVILPTKKYSTFNKNTEIGIKDIKSARIENIKYFISINKTVFQYAIHETWL